MGGTVLVVDDTAMVRKLLDVILRRGGYQVLLAETGAEALALWTSHQDTIDALVTDMVIGDMSGNEVVQALRRTRPDLPVVCASGHSVDDVRESLPSDVEFVEKPFTAAPVLDALARALARSAAPA